MFRSFILTLAISITGTLVFGQDSSRPQKILIPLRADRTPELRNMKIVMAGEKLRSWKNNEVANGQNTKPGFLKAQKQVVNDPVVQGISGTKAGQIPMVNIAGVGDISKASPSDACGDAGINHYIQMVNCAFAIWDKGGNLIYGPVDNNTLWDGFGGPWTGTNDGDGVVLYDEVADRWLMTQFAIPDYGKDYRGPYYQLIAVSQTGDPLGAWYRYAYQFDEFNDYPKFGVWTDGYYSTYNMFDKLDGQYVESAIVVFDREAMLAGNSGAEGILFKNGNFGFLPGDLDGPAPPANTPNVVLVAVVDSVSVNMVVFEFTIDWQNPALSALRVAATLRPAAFIIDFQGIPQPANGYKLDSHEDRIMYRLQHRCFTDYEVIMGMHTVKVDGVAAIRWYEIRKYTSRNWEIFQQGTFSPDSLHRWMGSIAMNGKGEIAVGYSAGSQNKWASVRYTGRAPDDDPGKMTFAETETASGVQNMSFGNRWGDYSCMSVDPVNDETFWYTSQFSGLPAWRTNIVSFNLGNVPDPIVDAGEDAVVCSVNRFSTNPTVLNEKSLLWTSTGDGSLLWADERIAQYKPGHKDLENGGADLILTAYGYRVGSVIRDTIHLRIELCNGISEKDLIDQVDIFPNPSPGVFNFNIVGFQSQLLQMEVLNEQGQPIFQQKLDNLSGKYTNQLDLSQFPSGTYFIRVFNKGKVIVRTLMKL